ncbi:amidohydrolase [Brachybacterium saurashtrense]|uniref:Amidohydrolase n=2 Tax=Brachybacterium saurashtrense TaxID=556288 RepID=A0A345YS35_9MICO|nr:amidohydrolase [Brachybacterium saurashtrense]AXK46737.1 amidohydrolase [Brachybacterium saurashtrense]RRR22452.1 amidohydrolase [Brachybacterium saurashtrense]
MTVALDALASWQVPLYEDLHRHPELSMREERTRGIVAAQLAGDGYEVHEIGGGVVGVLENGAGPTVLLRADIDGLPVQEATGLPYASTATQEDADGQVQPTMHACGHDVHTAVALGAARLLAAHREDWCGTYVALFQPGEEIAAGARAMVEDDLVARVPTPAVCLGQHVLTSPVAGRVAVAPGPVLSSSASMRVTVHGAGSHGSMPHLGVDPVVLAAAIVGRIQSLVSREISPSEFGVVTVGALHAGTSANIIPDRAELALNVRAYREEILDHLVEGVQRMMRAECTAARSPHEPEFELFHRFPMTDNDLMATARVREAFVAQFGADRVEHMEPVTASEDFSAIPDAFGAPYCYWGLGGYVEGRETAPNHSPFFAPDPQPTLRTGTEAAASAALAWLGGAG